ncbi:autotransporter outer membrane beta-barrel domain-containing protein [Neisseria lactamica]|uniref:Autotransporter outer membrane beta-barrel domain-containing protein n=1 Tax=Neisseria lactamica TaxID=486 RepID=A0AAU8VHI5_NEILA|nr:autotransporter outer membrane beta-barrel domain-containing protein [Neisseria lactamica]ARB05217.1 autotransporter outer membrane beta-barrel domain-containing protein [Neisseria lactamica]ARB05225.1 autotransporter outer membrane beta-barrel domain-containing protein [Neisseria lactamica]
MKQKKTVQCILLGFAAASMHAQGADAASSGTIEKTDKYTLVLAKQGQENNYTYDGETEVKPLNSLIIAANGGTNNITIKGKLADGSADAPPTIDNNSIERNINKNGYTYTLNPNHIGAVILADRSYEGENKVTFENVTIAAHKGNVGILSDDKTTSESLAPATLTFKGRNTINVDADSNANSSNDGILLFNNGEKVGEYRFVSEEGSTLNINIKSGKERGQGITANHYTSSYVNLNKASPSITTMEFKGDVNIKIDRNGQEEAENNGFGFYSSRRVGHKKQIPEGSKMEAIFRGNVDIVATPVYDGQGRPKSIGSAFAIDGKNSKVEVVGGEDKVVKIKGDIFAYNGGSVSVNLANKDSYFEGEAHIGKRSFAKGKDMFSVTVDADGNVPPTEKDIDSARKRLVRQQERLPKLDEELAKLKEELAKLNEDGSQEKEKQKIEKQIKAKERSKESSIKSIERDEAKIKEYEDFFDENGWIKDSAIDDKTKNTVNLKMSNGARWMVTNDSMLKELDLSEDAQVEFSDNNKFVKVSVSKLKGDGGVFKMYGDIVKGESDRLITRKGSEGTHIIEYEDNAKAKTTGREFLKLVENKGDAENTKASYELRVKCTEQGGWCFALGESGDSKKVNISADGKRDFYLYPATLSTGASSSVLFGEALYQLNAVSDETLVQRMGEIHADGTPQEDNNVWIKRVGGKFAGSRSDYRVGGYGNRYWGFAGGFNRTGFGDKWIHYKGLMLRHLQSSYSPEDYAGSGKIYGRTAGVYSTWLNRESRAYYDLVANIARYKGSYGLTNYAGKRVESDEARLNAYMLSAETGRRMEKQDGGKTYWWQPEAQLSYWFTRGYGFSLSNGLSAETDNFRSLMGRFGFRAGVDGLDGGRLNIYGKLMYKREFIGTIRHRFNGSAVEEFKHRGGWLEYGLGVVRRNAENGRQLYFEAQRSSMHKMRQNWQVNMGVRSMF